MMKIEEQPNLEDFQYTLDPETDYRLANLKKMVPKSNGLVLDLGCGTAYMSNHYNKTAKNVVAVDVSEKILKLAKQNIKNKNIFLSSMDAQKLAFKKESFDLIVALDVMEHLENDTLSLEECNRALKKKGKIFISVPAFQFLYGKRDKNFGHFRRYAKKELIKKLKNNNYNILNIRYWNTMGFIPYLISEKIFKKGLIGPARKKQKGVFSKFLSKILFNLLNFESKINFLPARLTLIAVAEKK